MRSPGELKATDAGKVCLNPPRNHAATDNAEVVDSVESPAALRYWLSRDSIFEMKPPRRAAASEQPGSLGRDGCVGTGSVIYGDARLYRYSEHGVVGLAEPTPTGYREHGRFTIPQQSGQPTWSHPIIAGGLLIIRDQDNVFAYDVRGSRGAP